MQPGRPPGGRPALTAPVLSRLRLWSLLGKGQRGSSGPRRRHRAQEAAPRERGWASRTSGDQPIRQRPWKVPNVHTRLRPPGAGAASCDPRSLPGVSQGRAPSWACGSINLLCFSHLTPSSPPRRPFLVARRACPRPGPDVCLHASRNSPGRGCGCQAGRDRVGPARSCVRDSGEVKGQSLLSPNKEPPLAPRAFLLTLSASCNPTSPRPQVTRCHVLVPPTVPAGQGHPGRRASGTSVRGGAHGPGHGVVPGASFLKPDAAGEGGRAEGTGSTPTLCSLSPQMAPGSPQATAPRGGLTTTKTAPQPPRTCSHLSTELAPDLARSRDEQTVNFHSRTNGGNSQFCGRQAPGAEPHFLLHPRGGRSPAPPEALGPRVRRGPGPSGPLPAGRAGGGPRASWLHRVLVPEPRSPKLRPNPPAEGEANKPAGVSQAGGWGAGGLGQLATGTGCVGRGPSLPEVCRAPRRDRGSVNEEMGGPSLCHGPICG